MRIVRHATAIKASKNGSELPGITLTEEKSLRPPPIPSTARFSRHAEYIRAALQDALPVLKGDCPLSSSEMDECFNRALRCGSVEEFKDLYLQANILKRWVGEELSDPLARRADALKKLRNSEIRCRFSNQVFFGGITQKNVYIPSEYLPVLRRARQICWQVLGKEFPLDELPSACDFSAGATTEFGRKVSAPHVKWALATHASARALPYVTAFRKWATLPLHESIELENASYIFTVNKNFESDRLAAKAVTWNCFFQKGVGKMIKRRLQRSRDKLLLPEAQDIHKGLARLASALGGIATVDLKNASNTVSCALVKALVPPKWWDVLWDLREDIGIPNWEPDPDMTERGEFLTSQHRCEAEWRLAKAWMKAEYSTRADRPTWGARQPSDSPGLHASPALLGRTMRASIRREANSLSITDREAYRNLLNHEADSEQPTFVWEMLAPNGCGFTFEVETLIFYSLVKAVCGDEALVSVYGDDIICPSRQLDRVIEVLTFCGFEINRDKTFGDETPFKESCGGHYYDGQDVKPFYLTSYPTTVSECINLHNDLIRWYRGVPPITSKMHAVFRALRNAVPKSFWGPVPLSGVLWCERNEAEPHWDVDTQSHVVAAVEFAVERTDLSGRDGYAFTDDFGHLVVIPRRDHTQYVDDYGGLFYGHHYVIESCHIGKYLELLWNGGNPRPGYRSRHREPLETERSTWRHLCIHQWSRVDSDLVLDTSG